MCTISELQALCALIGPFGMKQLNDSLMLAVQAEMQEIKVTIFVCFASNINHSVGARNSD